MGDRYEFKLSPELLKKAVAELNEPEDNAARLAAIDQLRNKFQEEQNDYELLRSDDAFLLRFLRVRKFDQDRAYETLVNYHKQRKDWKELFDMVDNPKTIKTLLSAGPLVPLKDARAKDGTFVVIGRIGRGMQVKEDVLKFMALIVLTVEKLLENEEFQIRGITVIEDMKEFTVSFAMHMVSYGRKFSAVMGEAMPVRIKGMNMVREALVFDILWTVMSAFMKEKMKKRLKLHGEEFKTLHEVIDAAVLPKFLGGTGTDLDEGWWAKEILTTVGIGEDTSL